MRIRLGPLMAIMVAATASACLLAGVARPGPVYATVAMVLTVGAMIVAARPGPRPISNLLLIALVLAVVATHNIVAGPRDVTLIFALPALAIVVALAASGRAPECPLPDPDFLAARALEFRRRAAATARPESFAPPQPEDFPGLW